MKLRVCCAIVVLLSFGLTVTAQTVDAGLAAATQVPRLIQFNNVATDEGGNTMSGVVRIAFSLYNVQRGGEPLWTETQNVQLDATGHYSVQLGITKPGGMPATLFTTGQARWLGIQIAEQAAQPRVLLMSVPYALKAGDAETIGGLPPSAFVLATPYNRGNAAEDNSAVDSSSVPPPSSPVTTSGGTVNKVPLWDAAADISNSAIAQSGSGTGAKIGINTTTPSATLDVKGSSIVRGILSLPATATATAAGGKNSQALNMAASAFNSSTSTAVPQNFRWQAEPVNNNSSSASGSMSLLFGQGSSTPSETGLKIASNGQISFAAGQAFPGTGTGNGSVTSVASGTGLTGGPITTSGTLSIDPSVVPEKAANNTFTGIQTFNNNNIFTGNQTFNGFNTFNGDQTFNGNITSNQIISGQTLSAASGSVTNNFIAGSISTASVASGSVGATILSVGTNSTYQPVTVSGTIGFVGGNTPLLMNSDTCCTSGTRMIWAHSPIAPQWGIYYDDSADVMHFQRTIGDDSMSINLEGHGVTTNDPLTTVGTLTTSGTLHVAGALTNPNNVAVGLPIAYGFINTNATIGKATSNVSVSWDSTNQWYVITMTGVNYFFSSFVTQVTPTIGTPLTVGTGSVSGNLLVQLKNSAGSPVQASFQFLVYQP